MSNEKNTTNQTTRMLPGHRYTVTHCRKGTMTIDVITSDDEMTQGYFIEGDYHVACWQNKVYAGELATMRTSFLSNIREVTK
jgi:hypothetical protein